MRYVSNRLRAGVAATLLGAALALPAGTAMADVPGPAEDQVSMACGAIKDANDPGAGAALSLYGIQAKNVKGKVGFFCTPTDDPKKANFCAVADQKDPFLALGKEGPCASVTNVPRPATPGAPAPNTPVTPPAGAPTPPPPA